MLTEEDEEDILHCHEDTLVIKANITKRELKRILVYSRNSMDIFFKSTLNEIRIINVKLEHINTSLNGFDGGMLTPLGVIDLSIIISTRPFDKNMLKFIVVEENNMY